MSALQLVITASGLWGGGGGVQALENCMVYVSSDSQFLCSTAKAYSEGLHSIIKITFQ